MDIQANFTPEQWNYYCCLFSLVTLISATRASDPAEEEA
jgi:hypothetical protein